MSHPAECAWHDPTTRSGCWEHLTMFMDLLEHRLPFLRGRSTRIEAACKALASLLNLSSQRMYELSLAARYHDIGMLGISDTILLKQAKLTPEEKHTVDLHCDWSGRLLAKAFPDFPSVIEAVWYHHERPDGTGPYGLHGDEIPLMASIVGLMEAVESMTNDRPHRKAWAADDIVTEIKRHRGTQFPLQVVSAFCRVAPKILTILKAKNPTQEKQPSPTKKKDHNSKPATASLTSGSPAKTPGNAPGNNASPSATVAAPTRSLDDISPVIPKNELVKLINEGLELRPLAATVQNVIAATNNAQCSAEDVARAVTKDQALSVRILKLANSSAYSRGRQVENVKEAVGRIGTHEVRKLVMTLGVVEQYEGEASKHVDPRLFWEHSIACGLLASAIGKECRNACSDDCFLWGMLHDVGRLILLEHISDRYALAWEAAAQCDVPLELVEERLFLLNHSHILQKALEHWHFPREFITPVVSHHQSNYQIKRLGPTHMIGAAIVALANRLAHALLLGSSGNEVLYPMEDLVELLELKPETLETITENIRDECNSLKFSLLARIATQEWPDLLADIRSRIQSEPRVLCVSTEPVWDSYGLFFQSILNDTDRDAPNLGVIYLSDARQQDKLMSNYERQEQKAGVSPLPLIILCNKGRVDENQAGVQVRPHRLLHTPVRIASLLAAVDELLVQAS